VITIAADLDDAIRGLNGSGGSSAVENLAAVSAALKQLGDDVATTSWRR
jgi:hypothetical protein